MLKFPDGQQVKYDWHRDETNIKLHGQLKL